MADRALTEEELSDENQWEEEWQVIMQTKGKYTLSKNQAILIKEALIHNSRAVVFDSFAIPVPYIAEFYRIKRFKKGLLELPAQATEEEYKPINPERYKILRKQMAEKIGKSVE